ncbi:MAG: spermidine synthase [Synechococcales cyanobacterium CRU_2_2]|nr:spermidine synthase [Synechococcales cyanobacterium CRU_2_2]
MTVFPSTASPAGPESQAPESQAPESQAPESYIFEDQTENLRLGFRVTQTLLSVQTPYQKLDVYQTVEFGKLMMLDDKVMLTERDEFFYHEMLVHPALFSHPNPRRVAVIGGGDGGAVREVLKHPSVEEVVWVEIDEAVVEASRNFFPTVSERAFSDARVKLSVAPGEEILPQYSDYFDVLIVDSTDPIGPAVPLFEAPFFGCAKSRLGPMAFMSPSAAHPSTSQTKSTPLVSNCARCLPRCGFTWGLFRFIHRASGPTCWDHRRWCNPAWRKFAIASRPLSSPVATTHPKSTTPAPPCPSLSRIWWPRRSLALRNRTQIAKSDIVPKNWFA